MFRRNTFIGFLLIIAISCSEKKNNEKNSARNTVISHIEGVVIKPSLLERSISVSGTVVPSEETELMSDVTGRVVSINFNEGTFVKKGAVLIQLFNDDLKAQLKKLQAQLEIARTIEKRQNELLSLNGISQQEFDQTTMSVTTINADIELVNAQLHKTEIHAPFDGVVGLRKISVGAMVTPATNLVTIRQVDELELEFSIPGQYSGDIINGKKMSFTIQGNNEEYLAVITASENGIDNLTRNLKLKAAIISKSKKLVPGMYANIELALKENKEAILVPTQAIIPQERNKRVVVSKNGKAVFKIVKTGVRKESVIEITEGILPGDTVVTTGILFVRPGSVLKFDKVTE